MTAAAKITDRLSRLTKRRRLSFFDRAAAPQLPALLLFLCIGSAFVLSPMPVWALTFYLGVMPATLYRLRHGRLAEWRDVNVLLVGLLIVWSAATLLWGENPGGGRVPKFLWGAVCTSFFFLALLSVLHDDARNERRLGSVLVFIGAANAALSILLYVVNRPADGRLVGWAETWHPILGALVIATSFICALDRALWEKTARPYYAGAALLCFLFIILTGSRGPLLTVIVAVLVLLVGLPARHKRAVVAAVVLCAAIIAVLMQRWLGVEIHVLLMRGVSYRPYIWSYTLQRVAERPWLGHGLAAYLGLPQPEFSFPHNLYLSALFYSGVVGLFLLLAVIGSVTWRLRLIQETRRRYFLLALWMVPLCGGLTDLGQVTQGPGELWLILWMPLAILINAGRSNPDRH